MKREDKSRRSRRTPLKEKYANGWLSPAGWYWPSRAVGHRELADKLAKVKNYSGEYILERQGWIKVSDNDWYSIGDRPLTQAQIDFVFDWCQINKCEYPPDYIVFMIEDMNKGLL